jgi:hypothetical protein
MEPAAVAPVTRTGKAGRTAAVTGARPDIKRSFTLYKLQFAFVAAFFFWHP